MSGLQVVTAPLWQLWCLRRAYCVLDQHTTLRFRVSRPLFQLPVRPPCGISRPGDWGMPELRGTPKRLCCTAPSKGASPPHLCLGNATYITCLNTAASGSSLPTFPPPSSPHALRPQAVLPILTKRPRLTAGQQRTTLSFSAQLNLPFPPATSLVPSPELLSQLKH